MATDRTDGRRENPGNDQGFKEELDRLFTKEQQSIALGELKRKGESVPTYRDILNHLMMTNKVGRESGYKVTVDRDYKFPIPTPEENTWSRRFGGPV